MEETIGGFLITNLRSDHCTAAPKNAFAVYKMLPELDPFSLDDLKKAHGMMMNGLVEEAGELRTGSVGVINEQGKVTRSVPKEIIWRQ